MPEGQSQADVSGELSAEPTYAEKLNGYLTDEFHFGLYRVLGGHWGEVLHGKWYCHLEFFSYLRAQLDLVLANCGNPLYLEAHLKSLNPSGLPEYSGGPIKEMASQWLPIYRQRAFLLNA